MRIKGTLYEYKYTFLILSRSVLLRIKIFHTRVVEKLATLLCSIMFFKNHSICEVMWKNSVECGRPQTTIWRMCISCWISKANLRLRNTHCFSTAKMVVRKRLNVEVICTFLVLSLYHMQLKYADDNTKNVLKNPIQ
jgi:hypothetical protein